MNAKYGLKVLSWTARNNINQNHADLVAEMKSYFDRCLEKNYLAAKSAGLPTSKWFLGHRPYIGLVVPFASFEACVNATSDWATVAVELGEVVCTEVGNRIFGRKFKSIVATRLSFLIDENLNKLKAKDIEAVDIKNFKSDMETIAKELGKDLYEIGAKREVVITYRGVVFPIEVASVFEELNVKLAAEMRSRGVDHGIVQPLFCEDQLISPDRVKASHKVDAALLRECILARDACADFMPSDAQESGPAVKEMLEKKKLVLHSMDRMWRIEEGFFSRERWSCGRKTASRSRIGMLAFRNSSHDPR